MKNNKKKPPYSIILIIVIAIGACTVGKEIGARLGIFGVVIIILAFALLIFLDRKLKKH